MIASNIHRAHAENQLSCAENGRQSVTCAKVSSKHQRSVGFVYVQKRQFMYPHVAHIKMFTWDFSECSNWPHKIEVGCSELVSCLITFRVIWKLKKRIDRFAASDRSDASKRMSSFFIESRTSSHHLGMDGVPSCEFVAVDQYSDKEPMDI